MSVQKIKSYITEHLYKYDWVRSVKELLRPLKQKLLGKNGLYYVIEEINEAHKESPVKVVFDIGAAMGDSARTFSKVFTNATMYCFEPQKESYARLERRTKHITNRIKLFKFAFLNKTGTEVLNVLSYADASSFLPVDPHLEKQGIKKIEGQQVEVKRLDDFVVSEKIDYIDFVKVDVEGVEKELLAGGVETFKNKVGNVFIEILPLRAGVTRNHHIEVFQFFYDAGFSYIGCYEDYFFTKDPLVLKKYSK